MGWSKPTLYNWPGMTATLDPLPTSTQALSSPIQFESDSLSAAESGDAAATNVIQTPDIDTSILVRTSIQVPVLIQKLSLVQTIDSTHPTRTVIILSATHSPSSAPDNALISNALRSEPTRHILRVIVAVALPVLYLMI